MHIRKRIFVYASLTLLLSLGCTNHVRKEDKVTTIEISGKADDAPTKINEFLKFSHFVALEANDDCLIGDINKLQIIDGKIYIMDWRQHALFAFDHEGKALFSIKKRGRAGDEYTDMSDFEVGADGSIFIYDQTAGKINVYDDLGRVKRRIDNACKGWSMKLLSENRIAYNLGNGIGDGSVGDSYLNYVCMEGDKVELRAIPFNKALLGHKTMHDDYISSFVQYGDKIFMSSFVNDTIYEVCASSGKITPFVAFDFTGRRLSADDPEKQAVDYLRTMTSGEIPTPPYCFYNFPNGVMASYNVVYKSHILIASSKGEIWYSGRPGYDENGLSTAFFTPYLDSDNTGYAINVTTKSAIASSLDFHKKSNSAFPVLDEIDEALGEENDNPVLLFYEWIN